MKFYHGTNKESYDKIMSEGFKIALSDDGRWGTGIYFTSDKQIAENWAREDAPTIESVFNREDILKLQYRDVVKLFPLLNGYEEEGTREIKPYTLNRGFKAIAIEYEDGEVELIVYDEKLTNTKEKSQ